MSPACRSSPARCAYIQTEAAARLGLLRHYERGWFCQNFFKFIMSLSSLSWNLIRSRSIEFWLRLVGQKVRDLISAEESVLIDWDLSRELRKPDAVQDGRVLSVGRCYTPAVLMFWLSHASHCGVSNHDKSGLGTTSCSFVFSFVSAWWMPRWHKDRTAWRHQPGHASFCGNNTLCLDSFILHGCCCSAVMHRILSIYSCSSSWMLRILCVWCESFS